MIWATFCISLAVYTNKDFGYSLHIEKVAFFTIGNTNQENQETVSEDNLLALL